MKKLLGILLKQYQLGEFPGAAKTSFGRSLVYVSYVQFCMIAAMARVTFRGTFDQYAPWLTVKMLLVIIVVGLLLVMLSDYKFMVPSEFNFAQQQLWKHLSPTKAEFEELGKKLDKTEEKNDKVQKELWKKLDRIEQKIGKGSN